MRSTVLTLIFLVAAGIFFVTLGRATIFAPSEPTYAPPHEAFSSASTTPDQLPARLIIPSLNIDTKIQYVGVNAKGAMGVPSNFTDVAWYQYGTVPGRRGSAVIDGHLDNGLSLPGVFKHLADLAPGSEIIVETAGGQRLRFIVQEAASYGYQDVPTDRLFNAADQPRLNLITCAGSWVKTGKTYDQRFVAYAVLAPQS